MKKLFTAIGRFSLLIMFMTPYFAQAQNGAHVGDFVFKDSNGNGVQDVGENGIEGVFVMLTTCDGDYVTHMLTDNAGAYLFSNVAPGSYKIKFALAPGYVGYSPKDVGDDALDSDVLQGWTSYTECFTVNGQDNMTIDAGFIPDPNLATEVTISCLPDMEIDANTTTNLTRAYFGDKQNNAVVVVNVEGFEKAGFVPTGHQITYTADKVGSTGKLYAVNRGSDAMDVIDGKSLELVSTIEMDHHPRSAERFNNELGLVSVTGMDKPMVSLVDMATDEVVATVGSPVVTYPVSLNNSGSHACGHPFWLDAHHFVLPDRGNLLLYCYSVYQVNGNWETTLLSATITPSPVHQIIPRKGHYQGPSNLFYASAEGISKMGVNNVFPSVLELQFTPGQGLHITRAATLQTPGVSVQNMGGHHGDFHPFQKKIYIGSRDGTLFVVDYENMTIHSTIQAGNGIGHVKMIASKNLAIGINHKDVFVTVIDLTTNTKIADVPVSTSTGMVGQTTLQAHPKYFVKGDKFYSFASYDGNFYELDLNTLTVSRILHLGGRPSQGAFVPVTLDGAYASWALPTATSDCGDVTLTQIAGPTNGTIIPQGNHTITYVASDNCGNTDTCSFQLMVHPTQPSGPADIGDFVFSDNNANGIQDVGEQGVAGVFVMLTTCNGDYVTHTTTDGSGHYAFTQVAPGSYKVKFALLPNYQFSPTDMGGDDMKDSDVLPGWTGYTACFDMVGQDRLGMDAGFVPENPPAGEITMSCVSDIQIIIPEGENQVAATWAVPAATSTCNPSDVMLAQNGGPLNGSSLSAGEYAVSYQATDACGNIEICTFIVTVVEAQKASIGDMVWKDTNGNGLQDVGEPGLEGVFVMLADCDGNWLNNVFTDATGHYRFEGLTPGYYKIKFALLPNYVFSPTNAGSNSELDSDVLPGWLGFTACFNLASGVSQMGIDAGFVEDNVGYVDDTQRFVDLEVTPDQFVANLNWQNNTGDENNFYLIERSSDGVHFEPLAQIENATESPKNVHYSYMDEAPLTGNNTYRVRVITHTGENLYSNLARAKFGERFGVSLYPNPTTDYIKLDLLSYRGESVRVTISDGVGRVVKSVYVAEVAAAPMRIGLAQLDGGYYQVVIQGEHGQIVTKKLVVTKQ